MDRKCSILGFVFQNLSTKKMMSHITSYLVGESLGKIQGQQKVSYYFIPLEMGQFVVSFTSLFIYLFFIILFISDCTGPSLLCKGFL